MFQEGPSVGDIASEVTKTKVLALLWPLEMPLVAEDADDSVLLREGSAHGITSSHGTQMQTCNFKGSMEVYW